MTTSSNYITQELFDETIQENEDVFDLDPEQAVAETIQQLSLQSKSKLSHLSLLHPDSPQGKQERQFQTHFRQYLEFLDKCVALDGSILVDQESRIQEALEFIRDSIGSNAKERYLTCIQQQDAMYTFMSLLGVVSNKGDAQDESRVEILQSVLSTLCCICNCGSVEFRDAFCAWDRWNTLFTQLFTSHAKIKLSLLQLACAVCKNCEPNKVHWMKSKTAIATLLDGLKMDNPKDNTGDLVPLWTESCRLITTLCCYDDFRPSSTGPTVSSAHEHVMELARNGAIPLLVSLTKSPHASENTPLLAACLSALRFMAIHDAVVQTMVALGLLTWTTQNSLHLQTTVHVLAATLGLLRNLSANDEIKTTLCCHDTLAMMVNAMQQHASHTQIQQHGCAVLGAMALRKPNNAATIVQHGGHACIVTAMKLHPTSVAIQRQGSLAIRNLTSRQYSNTEIQQAFLDLGVEDVLKDIAGQHQGSVDEAYAALRDLGCDNVSLLTVHKDGSTSSNHAEMFGQVQSGFRPVYDEVSEELQNL